MMLTVLDALSGVFGKVWWRIIESYFLLLPLRCFKTRALPLLGLAVLVFQAGGFGGNAPFEVGGAWCSKKKKKAPGSEQTSLLPSPNPLWPRALLCAKACWEEPELNQQLGCLMKGSSSGGGHDMNPGSSRNPDDSIPGSPFTGT